MQAMEMGSRNLVDDTCTIMETHNKMYSDEDVVNMTKNQWKKLIERNLADVANKEITNKCVEKKKVQHLMQENGNLKKYFTQYVWESARTMFEVRTNMVKLDCNFGHRESKCCICGDKESTEHIFECVGSRGSQLTQQTYLRIIQPEGPEFTKDKAEEITKEIRTIIKERKQIQDILNKYG